MGDDTGGLMMTPATGGNPGCGGDVGSLRFEERGAEKIGMILSEQWPPFDLTRINPPSMKRGVGRPAKNRRRQPDQAPPGKRYRIVRCGRCNAYGHNMKTCKGGLTTREIKEQQRIRVERRQNKMKPKEANNVEQADVMASAPWILGSQ